ncbi:MAG: ACT domain-containing protein [Elusimicrobiota bacterium]
MAYHLSIFVENKPGKIEKITKVLADNGINLRAITLASTGEYGVLKLLVNNPDLAYDRLKQNSIAVSKRKIIIAVIDDQPGGMFNLLSAMSKNNINLEDCYGFVLEDKKQAAIIMEVEKYPEAETVLAAAGIKLLPENELESF